MAPEAASVGVLGANLKGACTPYPLRLRLAPGDGVPGFRLRLGFAFAPFTVTGRRVPAPMACEWRARKVARCSRTRP
jgi:hypothetical protein